jgi:hypothetical protein
MVDYQKALAQVKEFAEGLDALKWPGVHGLHEWVNNAPKIWLTKKRESTLDWTRNQFSLGEKITTPISHILHMLNLSQVLEYPKLQNTLKHEWWLAKKEKISSRPVQLSPKSGTRPGKVTGNPTKVVRRRGIVTLSTKNEELVKYSVSPLIFLIDARLQRIVKLPLLYL